MHASTLRYVHSLVSTQAFRMRLTASVNTRAEIKRAGGPYNRGVTNSGRAWRKVPESGKAWNGDPLRAEMSVPPFQGTAAPADISVCKRGEHITLIHVPHKTGRAVYHPGRAFLLAENRVCRPSFVVRLLLLEIASINNSRPLSRLWQR